METVDKLPKFNNLDLSELKNELDTEYKSLQSGYDTAKTKRVDAYSRYSMKPYDNEVPGRSKSVDSTIFDKVEWLLAALLRPIVEGEEAVNIIPEGPDDVPAAEYLRELITYQLKKKNKWFLFHHTMIKQSHIGGDSYGKLHWEPANKIDGAAYVRIEAIRPSQIRYDWSKADFYDSDVIIHDTPITRSDIVAMNKDTDGYIKANVQYVLDSDSGDTNKQTADSKQSESNTEYANSRMHVGDGVSVTDKASKFYTLTEHWTKKDIDGSGIAQSVVASYINGVIVRFMKNPYPDGKPPFIYAQGIREPFSSLGWSQNDVLGDIQKNVTAINRDIIDNLALQTNGMWEVDTNYVDPQGVRLLTQGIAGSVIPVDRPQSINPLSPLPISAQAFEYRSVLQSDADSRSGFTKSESMDTKMLRSTATAANIVSSSSQLRVWEMAQRYVETAVKPMIRKVIAYNQAWLPKTSIQKVFGPDAGKWIFPDKSDIGGYFAVDIDVSLAGDKQDKVNQIMTYAQYMGPYAEQIPKLGDALEYMSEKVASLMGLKDFQAYVKGADSGHRGAVYPAIVAPEGSREGELDVPSGASEEPTGPNGDPGVEELATILGGEQDLGVEPSLGDLQQ
jgi:hypothetical protein